MKTLLERLKPEIKIRLESNIPEYSSTVDHMFNVLASRTFYQDLTMSEISTLYTFGEITLLKTSVWDLKYGDNLFINENND
tara:strand:+ start:180 stop:422 length:243 start_codon:yes stop_codon:yes gene_type:complete